MRRGAKVDEAASDGITRAELGAVRDSSPRVVEAEPVVAVVAVGVVIPPGHPVREREAPGGDTDRNAGACFLVR